MWLTGANHVSGNWVAYCEERAIDKTGFTLFCDTSDNSKVASYTVNYIAVPASATPHKWDTT